MSETVEMKPKQIQPLSQWPNAEGYLSYECPVCEGTDAKPRNGMVVIVTVENWKKQPACHACKGSGAVWG